MNQKNIKFINSLLKGNKLFLLIFLIACSPELKNEKQISEYLKKEYEINLTKQQNLIVVFLKNSYCGTCETKSLYLIKKLSSYTDYRIIVHYRKYDSTVEEIKKLPIEVIINKGNTMDYYGIILSKDLIVHYRSGKIVFFGWLFQDKIDNVYRYFFNLILKEIKK